MKYVCQDCKYTFIKKSSNAWQTCPYCKKLNALWENSSKKNIFTPFAPSWRKYESGMWGEDNKTAQSQADKFLTEREHEIKTDPRAARWEKSRKERWAKDKPAWVKMKQKKGEL